MTQQFTVPNPSGSAVENKSYSPVSTAEIPRAVRGYAVEVVDRLIGDYESRIMALQAKATKLEETNQRIVDDLKRCATELSAFREKESALLSAILSVEERKKSIQSDIDAAADTARAQAKEITDRATLEAAKIRSEAEQATSRARESADEVLELARRDAETLKANATAEADLILSQARTSREEILETARSQASEMTKDLESARAAKQAEVESLQDQYEQAVERVRTIARALQSAIPGEGARPATKPAPGAEGELLDASLAAA